MNISWYWLIEIVGFRITKNFISPFLTNRNLLLSKNRKVYKKTEILLFTT